MAKGKRRGYVLLMTLVVVALAAFLLASVSRQSLLLALEGIRAQEELQKKWGVLSCQRALLNNAEQIFEAQVDPLHGAQGAWRTASHLSATYELGGLDFHLRLADENAKVNLNTVHRLQNIAQVAQVVRELAGSREPEALKVRLRPFALADDYALDDDRLPNAFTSWGQVFVQGASTPESATLLAEGTENITCWGSGSLNLRRASDEALGRLAEVAVNGQVARDLLDIRSSNPRLEVAEMLSRLALRGGQRDKLNQLLTDRSSCYSVWITVTAKERSWREFHIRDSNAGEQPTAAVAAAADQTSDDETTTTIQFRW